MSNYRIPWIWGNTMNRDHANYAIRNDYVYSTTPGSEGRADPGFDTLDKIMTALWRVKTFTFTWSFSAEGTIDLFSHPIGEHTPWSYDFSGSAIATRRYVQDPSPIFTTGEFSEVNEERHLFGRFEPGGPPTSPEQTPPPLGSYAFRAAPRIPTSMFFEGSSGLGLLNPWLSLGGLNWRTTGPGGPVLEIIAYLVPFSGVPADLQLPIYFQDVRDFVDPMDDSTIIQMGVVTASDGNPAHPIGDATFDMLNVSISRKCYLSIAFIVNRGFVVTSGPAGSVAVEATEYFPFADSNGDPIYDTATGVELRDPFG